MRYDVLFPFGQQEDSLMIELKEGAPNPEVNEPK